MVLHFFEKVTFNDVLTCIQIMIKNTSEVHYEAASMKQWNQKNKEYEIYSLEEQNKGSYKSNKNTII